MVGVHVASIHQCFGSAFKLADDWWDVQLIEAIHPHLSSARQLFSGIAHSIFF